MVYLIGFMGAGKTEVGAQLAQRLGAGFVDLDRWVETEAGVPIAKVFEESGEQEFRRLEAGALAEVTARRGSWVVATGGGTVTRRENVEVMRSTGVVYWLDIAFEEILSRLDAAARDERPLFSSEPEARALYQARRQAYEAAGQRLEIGVGEGPEAVAERIWRRLAATTSSESPVAGSRR